ncbi:aldo/keto reductase [Streptomyces sp. NPDC006134]|uniref:aldo/keto reductase n=1 Tax=Streptomyces sp. NPDC006134 TaxID=3154467 RepID=UPI0033C5BAAC
MTGPDARPWLRPLGGTGLTVSAVCAGGAVLGSMPEAFGYEVPRDRAVDTVRRVLAGPINFLDTSNDYGAGESERRIGAALAEQGGLPDGFVLASKVDPGPDGDFSGARVRASLEESLERLGLSRLPLLHLHDPERMDFGHATAPGGPVDTLVELRREGLVDHIGVAGGPAPLMRRYVETGVFEVLITHNRWTLVDRSAGELIDDAHARGMAVVNAAVFGGGVLARGTARTTSYAYRPAPLEVLGRIREMERVCARHGVPLAAAALQFSLRDPRIASTVVGFSRPERVDETLRHASWPVPRDLWDELEPLAAPRRYWLDGG